MINQLRKIYSSLLVYSEGHDNLDTTYKWFVTGENEIVGIHDEELTSKDVSLLTTFLLPYNINLPIPTDEERKWKNAIHATESSANFEIKNPYRFIYFSIKKNQIDPTVFKDAIHELFANPVPILWGNGHEGIIIEEQIDYEDSISFEEIKDILMSDLSVKIHFFIGSYKEGLEDIAQYYHSLTNAAKKVFVYTNKTVVTYIDAVPYLLINQTEPDLRSDIGKTVLQEYINDEETLKMIETFLQCNLNISETAKVLHMHRNSLQYRLDRFFEKTGIDVRQFHHAMTVYLALLARK
ncbi:helix-turn-helix domain-containing protein [Sporosarcina sp. E16_8]|uniref:PucR family transcriptional regulator n=1 Tax=Sporosarcina sp. E16_8 TaxID=2789295 RepID=UPI001A91458A|nr:helix-turn-helix domain-containing protein [Sporosarcina sp. E16_8]MBO0587372.1 helix-turn-helix domain-containing protein [Sporosarcina sp. E16_8]